MTNMFGYYRTKGLRPETYTVSVAETHRTVTVTDDYIYGIDFTIEDTATAPEENDEVQEEKTDGAMLEKAMPNKENEQP